LVKARADEAGLFARGDGVVDLPRAVGDRNVSGGFGVTTSGLVGLRPKRRQILAVNGRDARESFGFLNSGTQRGVINLVGRSRPALLIDPDGNTDSCVLASPVARERIGRETLVRVSLTRNADAGIVGLNVAEQFVANAAGFLFAE
jgi:hypothetical protein